jgi:hypothetical protein
VAHGFWWSHCGWFLLTNRHAAPLLRAVPDLARLPELRWLERHYLVPPAALAAGLAAAGGARAVAYGFVVATVLCWHATYAINSVAHLLGGRRFSCEFNGSCTARNNLCAPAPRAPSRARAPRLRGAQPRTPPRAALTPPAGCRATRAACWPCSRWARGGTTTTTASWRLRATALCSRLSWT